MSRPSAAVRPSPMTASSMVKPLAVVIADMGIPSWSSDAQGRESPPENEPCGQRCCRAAEAGMYAKAAGLARSIALRWPAAVIIAESGVPRMPLVAAFATSHAYTFQEPETWDARRERSKANVAKKNSGRLAPDTREAEAETPEDNRRR